MPARFIEAHPLVEETLNRVAVQRGPLVYCLEPPDLLGGDADPGCNDPSQAVSSSLAGARGGDPQPQGEGGDSLC